MAKFFIALQNYYTICLREIKMREFTFTQLKDGYRYNSDTLLLYDFISKHKLKGFVLEVGCGCGIIGILLKHKFEKIELFLLDILQQNYELCEINLKQNNISAQLFCEDFFSFSHKKKFDFILCNPPFYRNGAYESTNLHKKVSKFQSSFCLDSFIKKSNSLLKANGTLYFCYESSALESICSTLTKYKLRLSKICFVYKDEKSKARLVLLEAKKSFNGVCEVMRPFFMYKDKIISPQMQELSSSLRIKSLDL